METTRYTGKDLAQTARNTAKQYKLRFVSWELVVCKANTAIQTKGIDANGHENTINVAL